MTDIVQRSFDTMTVESLQNSGYSPLLARLLAARGVRHAQDAELSMRQLLAPTDLRNIAQTAQHISDAIAARHNITIIADYDCDGATACAVAVRGLKLLGALPECVDFLVPNRFDYGYGLSPEIVQLAAHQTPKPDLLITVDNGMASIDGVALANQLGFGYEVNIIEWFEVEPNLVPGTFKLEIDLIGKPLNSDTTAEINRLVGETKAASRHVTDIQFTTNSPVPVYIATGYQRAVTVSSHTRSI